MTVAQVTLPRDVGHSVPPKVGISTGWIVASNRPVIISLEGGENL